MSLETSEGLLILDVNFFHPSSFAVAIAILYSLRRVLYAFLPSGDFFLAIKRNFALSFERLGFHQVGNLYLLLQRFLGQERSRAFIISSLICLSFYSIVASIQLLGQVQYNRPSSN